MLIRIKKSWEIPERDATPEHMYWNRRRFLTAAGAAGVGLLGLDGLRVRAADDGNAGGKSSEPPGGKKSIYPARQNPAFTLDRPITDENTATSYNNFYEFSFGKTGIARLAKKLVPSPWTLEVTGLVSKPRTFDVDDLLKKMPLEERLYRFRCVEAWAMAVPWAGFPLSKLLGEVEPLGSAKFVRFVTFHKPEWGPGFASTEYPWPYFEALSLAEARSELTLLATGVYGKPLPNQNGAPIRLIVPWKYGFKSIKSIVKIELVDKQPATFWSTVIPDEYDFVANVNPEVPHPRWSQATERMIGTGERRKTLPFNGYGELVAKLYA